MAPISVQLCVRSRALLNALVAARNAALFGYTLVIQLAATHTWCCNRHDWPHFQQQLPDYKWLQQVHGARGVAHMRTTDFCLALSFCFSIFIKKSFWRMLNSNWRYFVKTKSRFFLLSCILRRQERLFNRTTFRPEICDLWACSGERKATKKKKAEVNRIHTIHTQEGFPQPLIKAKLRRRRLQP